MSELVVLDGFSLLPQGATLTLALASGQSLAVVGPAASGKSRFLRCVQGRERPGQGRAALLGDWVEAKPEGSSRRATPQTISRKAAGRRAGDASQALTMTGLWDERETNLDSLSDSQRSACALLAPLAASEPIIFLDGQLDTLDSWTRHSALEGFRERQKKGACLIVATNRLEMCAEFDLVVVMRSNRVAFAGTLEELYREGDESTVVVETRNQPGVRALVEPFEISVKTSPEGLVLTAREGQAIAAKLLMEGYGDVRSVVLKQPTVEDAVRRVVGRA